MDDVGIELPKRLVFKTWNTSLHPPKGKGRTMMCFVVREINELLKDCDILYLCEFDCNDVTMGLISILQTQECFKVNNVYGKPLIVLKAKKGACNEV